MKSTTQHKHQNSTTTIPIKHIFSTELAQHQFRIAPALHSTRSGKGHHLLRTIQHQNGQNKQTKKQKKKQKKKKQKQNSTTSTQYSTST